MKEYRIIKLFIEDLLNLAMVIYWNIFRYKLFLPLFKRNVTKGSLVIIGSGPSVFQDLNEIENLAELQNDYLAFNSFISTNFSKEIRPNFYMLVDPAFFAVESSFNNPYVKNKIEDTWKKLGRTDWKMVLIVPRKFRNSTRLKKIGANEYIKISFMHEKPLVGGSKRLNYFLLKLGLGHPVFQNVLIGGLIFGIEHQYEFITIFGSDHSFHEHLEINNQTNALMNNERSLGSREAKVPFRDYENNRPKISEFFNTLSITFRSYEIIDYIAKKKGIQIKNKASRSFIDAFIRN